MKGVDYSWARPGAAAIKAAGFEFVMRYVDYPGAGSKGLRTEELEELRDNGLAIGMVWETTAGRTLEGYSAGAQDATAAADNLASLGFPEFPIYFAVDFDAQPSHYSLIDSYFSGCVSVLGIQRVGVYGSYSVVEHCRVADLARWFWQTSAWSGGKVSAYAHIHQYMNGQTINGAAVDFNDALQDDFGQWKTEEEDMTVIEDILLALYAGSEERDPDTGETLPRAQRLTAARFRASQAADGRAQSVAEQAASAAVAIGLHIANHPGGNKVADHTHKEGPVNR